jgi:amino acid permease
MNYCIICLASSLFIGYFIYNKNNKSNIKFNQESQNQQEESKNQQKESSKNQYIEITNNDKLLEYDNFLLNAIKSINK